MTTHTQRRVSGILAAVALASLAACKGNDKTTFTLSVTTTGSGGGTVTSGPAGIDCGSTCSARYAEGARVTLTPTAADGSTFIGWGGACTGTGACAVAMTADGAVTASFESNVAPAGTDLLGGAGAFDAVTDPSVWFLQGPDGASLDLATCAGFTQRCATISGADLGASDYDAQLIYWNTPSDAPRYATLRSTKAYSIALRGSASVAGTPIRVALIDNTYTEVGSSTFTLGTTPVVHVGMLIQPSSSSPTSVTVRVNVGGAANAGVTLQLDDLQVIEQDSGGPPPPTGTDLLSGNGSFDTAEQQASWFANVATGAGAASLTFPACADLTGSCAVFSSPDYGADNWRTQLAYGQGTVATLTLDASKTYRLTYKGKVVSPDNLPRNLSVWMQHDYQWPPAINYSGSLTTTAASYDSGDLTLDPTYVSGGTVDVDLVINLGPDAASHGVTFYLDEIELLER